MKIFQILIVLSALFIVGCGSTSMVPAPSQAINTPSEGNAQFVFMRSSFFGGAISASLFDVTDIKAEPVFIGIIDNNTKLTYSASPGKYTFMVVSEAADFMEANVVGGKTYYAMVTPRMGAWKARFSLWPVRNDGSSKFNTTNGDFAEYKADTKLMTNSEKSKAWFTGNLNSIKSKQVKHWVTWKQKTSEALKEKTLNPNDGL
ncbi:MAG: hypothetical protein HRT35_15530 [Algicola sp.]|nr:hypothetical protein [Algicola sp.]